MKDYVRPMMESEDFAANEYIAACGVVPPVINLYAIRNPNIMEELSLGIILHYIIMIQAVELVN